MNHKLCKTRRIKIPRCLEILPLDSGLFFFTLCSLSLLRSNKSLKMYTELEAKQKREKAIILFSKKEQTKKLPDINNGIKTKRFLIQCLIRSSSNIATSIINYEFSIRTEGFQNICSYLSKLLVRCLFDLTHNSSVHKNILGKPYSMVQKLF